MSTVEFFIYTIIAGSLFAYVLLWVIASWLKADEEVEEAEKSLEQLKKKLDEAGCEEPAPGCSEYEQVETAGRL